MGTPRRDPERNFAMLVVDSAYAGKAWQGATLTGSIRGLTLKEALWRPGPKRKCIWEHALHCAYWKHAVVRALTGDEPPALDRSPSNWPAPPSRPTTRAWREDVALLNRIHALLRGAVDRVAPEDYPKLIPNRRNRYGVLIAGIAAHDLYHTGQIQLIKRLARES